MPEFKLSPSTSIHALKSFLNSNNFFDSKNSKTVVNFPERWLHIEPVGLVMLAAWGAWCKRTGKSIEAVNLTKKVGDYTARMKVFDHLDVKYDHQVLEHEEAGRFLPVKNIRDAKDVKDVIADVSVLLHLQDDLEALSAVQYCMSELLRNVLEHASSPDGAFVCAHNFHGKGPHRITLAVADCGIGITQHLSRAYPKVINDDLEAIRLSMLPGITGALPGVYGTPDNAGAGLFITRSMAKGLGGYFVLISGNAAYRLRRAKDNEQLTLLPDPFADRADRWKLPSAWLGTVAVIEIPIDKIGEYEGLFEWIRQQLPPKKQISKKVRFT